MKKVTEFVGILTGDGECGFWKTDKGKEIWDSMLVPAKFRKMDNEHRQTVEWSNDYSDVAPLKAKWKITIEVEPILSISTEEDVKK